MIAVKTKRYFAGGGGGVNVRGLGGLLAHAGRELAQTPRERVERRRGVVRVKKRPSGRGLLSYK